MFGLELSFLSKVSNLETGLDKISYSNFELWIEKLAKFSKFKKLGENIGPFVLIWIFISIHTALGYVISTRAPNPHLNKTIIHHSLVWIGLTFSIWASRKLRDDYMDVLKDLNLPLENHAAMRMVLFLGGFAVIVGYILVFGGVIPNPLTGELTADPGWGFTWYWMGTYLIWLLVFLPPMVDFTTLIFVVHFSFPLKIKSEGAEIDWSDMERKLGLKKAGEMFLKSLQIYLIGLAIVTLIPIIWGISGLGTTAFFAGGWTLAVVLFFVPSFLLHAHMKREKEKKLDYLRERIERHRDLEGGRLEIDEDSLDHEELSKYLFLYLEHEHIYNISEYPYEARDLREVVFALLIPFVSQILTLSLL